jgi:hypothetical protein
MTIFNTTPMIAWLLEDAGNRDDVNRRDFSQRTPLHEAAFVGNYEVVQVSKPRPVQLVHLVTY